MPDYLDKLETGLHINASAHYMLKDFLGVGAEYSFFKTSASGSLPIQSISSLYLLESESYRLFVNYVGASVLFQQHPGAKRKIVISESFSAGISMIRMEYQTTHPYVTQNGYTDITNNMLLTGNSFSGKLGLSADYRIFKTVSVGLGTDFILGSLKKASIQSKGSNNYNQSYNDQDLSYTMKLSRFDFSFVVRYYL
jgi:hypothetical protein